jgi:hypothetical protein
VRRLSTPRGPRGPGVRRALVSAVAVLVLLASAPPAGAAPLTVTHVIGPQGGAAGTALLLQEDFEPAPGTTAARTLSGAAAGAPAGATWASTDGTWSARGGAAVPTAGTSALTVDGKVADADATAVLVAPSSIFGLLTVSGSVRYGIAVNAGGAGRIEGGLACENVLSVLAPPSQTCALVITSVIGTVVTELCRVTAYPVTSTSPAAVRLRSTGSTATLSVLGSSTSCSTPVPISLRAQTRVGVAVGSTPGLNLLGNAAVVLQVTAVRTAWAVPPVVAGP